MSPIAAPAPEVPVAPLGDLLSTLALTLTEVIAALFSEVLTEVVVMVVALVVVLLLRDVVFTTRLAPDGGGKALSAKADKLHCDAEDEASTCAGSNEEVEIPSDDFRDPPAKEAQGHCQIPLTVLLRHRQPVVTSRSGRGSRGVIRASRIPEVARPTPRLTKLGVLREAEESPASPRFLGVFRETRRALREAAVELDAKLEVTVAQGGTGTSAPSGRKWRSAAATVAKVFSLEGEELEELAESVAEMSGAAAWRSAAAIVANVFSLEAAELEAEFEEREAELSGRSWL